MGTALWWIIPTAFAVVFLFPVIYYKIRRWYARRKVAKRSVEEKTEAFNKDLEPFGFVYDEKQDLIYSGMYPWQRELGYCRLYDEAALALNMAIHSEPVYFAYHNRRWLIEFWKGQYGMTTGGEVGIYVTDKEDISIPGVFEGPFFECVPDEERIVMEYVLYKDKSPLFVRKDLHWWLTGFEVGQFTSPNRLVMDIRMTFPNRGMLLAFLKGLHDTGYKENEYRITGNTVQLRFDKPKTKQPYRKVRLLYYIVQGLNRMYCGIFKHVTKDFVRTVDKLDYLRFLFPWMYRSLTGFVKPKKMQMMYGLLKKTVRGEGEQ